MPSLSIGSLFTGYGGLDLACHSLFDANLIWYSEIATAPKAILETRFPGVTNLGDISKINWSNVESVDVLTGGYPCQPFSHAGRRKGQHDKRHLWPYVYDAIGTIRPRLVILENVLGHLTLGLQDVLGDLASVGYDAAWGVVRAADAGAPHGRKRIFIVAYPDRGSCPKPRRTDRGIPAASSGLRGGPDEGQTREVFGDRCAIATDSRGERWQERVERERGSGLPDDEHRAYGIYTEAIIHWESIIGRSAPALTDAMGRLDAPFVEWMMGLPEGWVSDVHITRASKLTALGNGVVPQQAELAIRTLLELVHA